MRRCHARLLAVRARLLVQTASGSVTGEIPTPASEADAAGPSGTASADAAAAQPSAMAAEGVAEPAEQAEPPAGPAEDTAPVAARPSGDGGGQQQFMRPVTAGMIRPPPGFIAAHPTAGSAASAAAAVPGVRSLIHLSSDSMMTTHATVSHSGCAHRSHNGGKKPNLF